MGYKQGFLEQEIRCCESRVSAVLQGGFNVRTSLGCMPRCKAMLLISSSVAGSNSYACHVKVSGIPAVQ
eukprot:scaffold19094_cov21-Prasinocladus_malaysianus.AAC.1